MNQKTLKKLRKYVRSQTANFAVRGLDSPPMNHMRVVVGFNPNGTEKTALFPYTNTVRNLPATQRGVYRQAKRAIAAAR